MPHSKRSGPTGETSGCRSPPSETSPGKGVLLVLEPVGVHREGVPHVVEDDPFSPTLGTMGTQLQIEDESACSPPTTNPVAGQSAVAGGTRDGGERWSSA